MKVLLHICCGVCASSVAERLMCEGHRITGFFYNPNIHPVDEYKKRLKAAQEAAGELGFELVEGLYDRERWFQLVKGKEYEPEGGARCEVCFTMRLERTYKYFLTQPRYSKAGLKEGTFDAFTTTLTVSPHKDAVCISAIGRKIGGERFISADYKKKGGFDRAKELSHQWGLYHQHYCGCIYSLESKLAKDRDK